MRTEILFPSAVAHEKAEGSSRAKHCVNHSNVLPVKFKQLLIGSLML